MMSLVKSLGDQGRISGHTEGGPFARAAEVGAPVWWGLKGTFIFADDQVMAIAKNAVAKGFRAAFLFAAFGVEVPVASWKVLEKLDNRLSLDGE